MTTRGIEIVAEGGDVLRSAQTWVNIASPRCKVFVRTHGGTPDAVGVYIGVNAPLNNPKNGYDYTPAEAMGILRQYPAP